MTVEDSFGPFLRTVRREGRPIPGAIVIATDEVDQGFGPVHYYEVTLRPDQVDLIANKVTSQVLAALVDVMALDKDGRLKTAPPEPSEDRGPFQPTSTDPHRW